MSTTTGRVFIAMTRAAFSRGVFIHNSTTTVRLNSVRPLALSAQMSARSKRPTDDEEVNSGPIKFSTSKASHRTWKVDRSLGSQFEQPWWKVLPFSLFIASILVWCVLRKETDFDRQLYDAPDVLSDEQEEQAQNKPN